MEQLLFITQCIGLILFSLSTLYIFIFSALGLLYKSGKEIYTENFQKIAVLIPGYKEDAVILDVAQNSLKQEYPEDFFDVIVIADSFKKETLIKLSKMNLKVIEVSFENSTKSKALNKAMSVLPDNFYDIALVLDADNIMESDFLYKINRHFTKDVDAVQGHRTAKNMNTSFAVLDAVSEEINNHIFRKGHRAVGLSSAIIGSGMAFRYNYFKSLMANAKSVGGFDKEVELVMLKDGRKIEYLDNALVFDEKVQKSNNFSNQRKRWLSAQVHYFKKFFIDALINLFLKGNFDYFDKAFQMTLIPRAMLIGLIPAAVLVSMALSLYFPALGIFVYAWTILLILLVISLVLAVPHSLLKLKTLKALLYLPKGILLFIHSFLKIKGANKKFIHTTHGN